MALCAEPTSPPAELRADPLLVPLRPLSDSIAYDVEMPAELIVPSAIMSAAFVFYTTGVFAERVVRDLRAWHVVLFWLGILCDATATRMMSQLRAAGQDPGVVHTVTGGSALLLMLGHALWATWTLWRGSAGARAGFHRYSIAVWMAWLIPYFGGMIAGITAGTRIG